MRAWCTDVMTDRDAALFALYLAHYRRMLELATGLVRRPATAEQIVQDAFTALWAAWPRLRDNDKALSYLRKCVENRARSVLRHCRDEARPDG
jgi:DNA-directed RNA polymerase specialized sigma24 family protein